MQILCFSANGPALLGMLDIEMLEILSVKCNTIDLKKQIQEINEQ